MPANTMTDTDRLRIQHIGREALAAHEGVGKAVAGIRADKLLELLSGDRETVAGVAFAISTGNPTIMGKIFGDGFDEQFLNELLDTYAVNTDGADQHHLIAAAIHELYWEGARRGKTYLNLSAKLEACCAVGTEHETGTRMLRNIQLDRIEWGLD